MANKEFRLKLQPKQNDEESINCPPDLEIARVLLNLAHGIATGNRKVKYGNLRDREGNVIGVYEFG